MRLAHLRRFRTAILLTGAFCMLFTTGCAAYTANLLYLIQGTTKPAECDKLEDKIVAVVCVSEAGDYGPDDSTQRIARSVGKLLAINVDGIKVIHHGKVNDWLDHNEDGSTNFRRLGKDLEAEMVLAISISDYSLHEGQTLYKGRADVQLELYDLAEAGGEIVWEDTHYGFSFPHNSGLHISSMKQAKFEQLFIRELTVAIARHFHSYEAISDVARDARAHSY